MRHAYQKIQVDFPDLVIIKHDKSEVEKWENEFSGYIKPSGDIEMYSQQFIEKDAIDYSEKYIYEMFR